MPVDLFFYRDPEDLEKVSLALPLSLSAWTNGMSSFTYLGLWVIGFSD